MESSSEERFVFGVSGLDEVYKNALKPGMLIAIAGYPGAGKTTLAATMCIANIALGHKCLYLSTQEDEYKVVDNLKGLGIDISKYIENESLKYVRVPMPSSDEAVDSIVETIASLVLKYHPKILIIDSLSSIVKILEDVKRRALLQNFFADIARDIRGLVIVTVEIPLGADRIEDTGDIEFVADAIIVLKHSLRNGTLSRRMEIRKLRASPIPLAEIPFGFTREKGIEIAYMNDFVMKDKKPVKLSIKGLDEVVGHVKPGEIATIVGSPLYISDQCAIGMASRIARDNSAKVLLFSFIPMKEEEIEVNGGSVRIVTVDPTRESLEEVTIRFYESIKEFKPHVVISYGLNVLLTLIPEEDRDYLNRILVMNSNNIKKAGCVLIRLMACSDYKSLFETPIPQISDILMMVGGGYSGLPEGRVIVRSRGSYKVIEDPEIYSQVCSSTQ